MPQLSELTARLTTSSVLGWEIHTEAAKRKAAGEDVYLLSIGDPDFNTPESIARASALAIYDGKTHYGNPRGEFGLRDAIAKNESTRATMSLDAGNVNIFNGATHAMHSTLACIANLGDSALLIEPFYIGYTATLNSIGVQTSTVATRLPNFDLNISDFESTLKPNTKFVVLNTPSNPCGSITPPETMRAVMDICKDRDIWLICDEVYSLMYYEIEHTSMLSIADDLDNLIVIDSLSKSHAMSGWRVGWTITNKVLADTFERYALASYFTGNQFVQQAATTALQGDLTETRRMRDRYWKRRDYTLERISQIPGIDAACPQAGMFIMVNVHSDGYTFAQELLAEKGVSVSPGVAFGESTKNYIRVSLGLPDKELALAWDRIEEWMSNTARAA